MCTLVSPAWQAKDELDSALRAGAAEGGLERWGQHGVRWIWTLRGGGAQEEGREVCGGGSWTQSWWHPGAVSDVSAAGTAGSQGSVWAAWRGPRCWLDPSVAAVRGARSAPGLAFCRAGLPPMVAPPPDLASLLPTVVFQGLSCVWV